MKTLERRLAEILAGARARLDDQVTQPHHTAAPGAPARGTHGDDDPTLRSPRLSPRIAQAKQAREEYEAASAVFCVLERVASTEAELVQVRVV